MLAALPVEQGVPVHNCKGTELLAADNLQLLKNKQWLVSFQIGSSVSAAPCLPTHRKVEPKLLVCLGSQLLLAKLVWFLKGIAESCY
jgi:hypothetical protein